MAVLLLLAAAVLARPAAAYQSPSTAAYEHVPLGARAMGLGGAFTAIADDATTVYWNPAGLSRGDLDIYTSTFAASYSALPWDRRMGFLALSRNVPYVGVFAAALTHATVGSVPIVDAVGNQMGAVQDAEDTLFLNASKRMNARLAVGASVKVLSQSLGTYHALGAGVDFGLHWQPFGDRGWPYFLGLVVQDAGSFLGWNTAALDTAAPTVRLGQSWSFFQGQDLRVALDVEGRSSSRGAPWAAAQFGAEGKVYDGIWLRAGADSFRQSLSAGVSFLVRQYSIDYAVTRAFADTTEPLQHRISLTGKM